MITKPRQLLSYQMTLAEWMALGMILGTPYLIVGVIWSSTHTNRLREMQGADLVVSFLG